MKLIKLTNAIWTIDDTILLGQPGGFGQVHPGTDANGNAVAVKILRKDIGDAAHRELEFAQSIVERKTNYIVPILDFGVDSETGNACIVMERATRNLRKALVPGQKVPDSQVLQVLYEIAQGLIEAGDWIHRDLKPENVLELGTRWQIADFGIARLAEAPTSTHTLKSALTPQYAAPEQWEGRRATHSTDIYALGCIGYEMLHGVFVFLGPDLEQQHRHETPKFTEGTPLLRSLLTRMMAKPQSARPDARQVVTEATFLRDRKEGNNPASARLASVAAQLAEETSRREADEIAAKAAQQERIALAQQANIELNGIIEELVRRITSNAPQASARRAHNLNSPVYEIVLGRGRLTITIEQYPNLSRDAFRECKWDVVTGGTVIVQTTNRYIRSASLWYAKLGTTQHQWIEIAYWNLNGDLSKEPCYLPPGRDADFAAAPIMHSWQLAHKPRPFAGAGLDVFCDRWMDFFAQAAGGTLAYPSRLPED